MKRITRFRKKTWVLLGVVAVIAAMASVGAYAYFTTTASGNGTATVGENTELTIVQVGSVTGLTPGGGAQSVSYSIDNSPASNGVQNLGAVSISNIVVGEPHATNGCLAAWFSSTVAANPVGTIGAGSTYNSVALTRPSIQLDNISSSQDACQGATLSFDLDAAQGS